PPRPALAARTGSAVRYDGVAARWPVLSRRRRAPFPSVRTKTWCPVVRSGKPNLSFCSDSLVPEPTRGASMTETLTSFSDRYADSVFERTSSRLRALQPDHPRVYAVAAVADHGRRRWWKLSEGLREGRIELMYRRHAAEMS